MASISRSPSPRPTSSSGGGAAAPAGGQTLHPSSSLTLGVPRRAASAPPEPSPARAEPQQLRMRAPRISESTLRLFESSWFNIGMAISYLYRFRADEETQAVSCSLPTAQHTPSSLANLLHTHARTHSLAHVLAHTVAQLISVTRCILSAASACVSRPPLIICIILRCALSLQYICDRMKAFDSRTIEFWLPQFM